MQSVGNSLGLGVVQVRAEAYIPIGWKILHPSHSVVHYRGITCCWNCAGMDFSISVQTEHAVFWSDQGASVRRFEQDQAEVPTAYWNVLALPATEREELLEWPLTAPEQGAGPVRMLGGGMGPSMRLVLRLRTHHRARRLTPNFDRLRVCVGWKASGVWSGFLDEHKRHSASRCCEDSPHDDPSCLCGSFEDQTLAFGVLFFCGSRARP